MGGLGEGGMPGLVGLAVVGSQDEESPFAVPEASTGSEPRSFDGAADVEKIGPAEHLRQPVERGRPGAGSDGGHGAERAVGVWREQDRGGHVEPLRDQVETRLHRRAGARARMRGGRRTSGGKQGGQGSGSQGRGYRPLAAGLESKTPSSFRYESVSS